MSMQERILKARKAAGLSQTELADRLGITQGAVGHWETRGGYPDTRILKPLATELGVTVDWLLGDEPGELVPESETGVSGIELLNQMTQAIAGNKLSPAKIRLIRDLLKELVA